jgi:hypothetical protein
VIAQELDAIARGERRLLDALVAGEVTAEPMRERLRAELARRDVLTAELATLAGYGAPRDAQAIVRDVRARATNLRGLLTRQVAQARQVVRLLLEGC